MTEQQILKILKSPFINTAAVSRELYPFVSAATAKAKFKNKISGIDNRRFDDGELALLSVLFEELLK